ncbi:MAG: glutathione S-transferase N-terminal domain-containing protein [Candidatus Pacebacteria bacterium]|nr:glutathione S-transferase N-terminal domain-containing protein [Candidatus Paceibacterota bacterium]
MLTLYVLTGCPYCEKVLEKVEALGVEVEKKDIVNNDFAKELEARAGRRQVPYLVDSERGEEMLESDVINKYLEEHYGPEVESNE